MNAQLKQNLPAEIFAEAVVRSASGKSLLQSPQPITSDDVASFHAFPETLSLAAERLQKAGFNVLDIGQTSINIAAPAETYERSLKTQLEIIERPAIKDFGQQGLVEFINSIDQTPFGEIDVSGTEWSDILDGVAINTPAYYLQGALPSATPPVTTTRYLQVPNDLAEELCATLAHDEGITGKGVKVAVVDSGCYAQHPFFQRHRYNLNVVLGPGATNPSQDDNGHGTGVSANVFAIAPEVDLTVVKADVALTNKYSNINSTAAFRKAVSLRPDIISCSWGSDLRSPYYLSSSHKVLAAVIADAVRQGIVVIFAAGNGHWGFPSQHPDVIAVGGVFKHLEGSLKGRLEASNYASSFISAIYPNRRVPDVCGLVGQLPNAAYIMLPVPPGSETDQKRALIGDETETTDGWAAFSGTSSAAPQLAGACALLEQFVPGLGPLKTKQILQETASDILEGSSNIGSGGAQARDGPDLATGYGLAVAYEAIQAARHIQEGQAQSHSNYSLSLFPETLRIEQANPPQFKKAFLNQYVEKVNTMNLDKATLKELRKKIDEIQIDLNTYLKEELLPETSLGSLELVINENNFIEQGIQSEAVSYFLRILRELVVDREENASESCPGILIKGNLKGEAEFQALISKKHISAAEGLLRRGKCQELAKNVLLRAIKLSGIKITWEILGLGSRIK